ncbi:MAG: hypothetical protein Q9217_001945 [Psora testacea]
MAPTVPSPSLTLNPLPLNSSSFASFGTVITSPLPPKTTAIPHPLPTSSVSANQNTALKYPNISLLTSTYRLSPSGAPAFPRLTLFACFPRQLRPVRRSSISGVFDVRILERHTYTTQTFLPLIPSSGSKSNYIVIVAPMLPTPTPVPGLTPYFPQAQQAPGLPDLKNIKAFVAEPGMGVTYGVGVWHAPMVVVGGERIDFVVSQWMSGREEEDCQEVELMPGEGGRGIEVVIEEPIKAAKAKL